MDKKVSSDQQHDRNHLFSKIFNILMPDFKDYVYGDYVDLFYSVLFFLFYVVLACIMFILHNT